MSEYNRPVDYGTISRIYDVSRAANTETVEKLVALLKVNRDSLLLDMGCGTGNYAASLWPVAKSIIGIDISTAMLKQANAKFPFLPLVNGDITCLPFGSDTFDGALAVQVLHHVKQPDVFLAEARRVLKNGACIAVHSCSHRQMRSFWFYHYFPRGLEADLARIPDAGEIAGLLERAGFSGTGIEICYHDVVVRNETPENYLDGNYRNGVSTFSFLTGEDVAAGCEKIRADIASGATENIVRQAEAEVSNEVGGSCIIYGRK